MSNSGPAFFKKKLERLGTWPGRMFPAKGKPQLVVTTQMLLVDNDTVRFALYLLLMEVI